MRFHIAVGVPMLAGLLAGLTQAASANSINVDMNSISDSGVGEKIGTIVVEEKPQGLSFKVDISGIAPGEHGFHVHSQSDCAPGEKDGKQQAGIAAGGHYDPAEKKTHQGPSGQGHKGDLPFLTSTDKGVNVVVTAPHLTLNDIRGKTLMVHAGGDNYSDHPENGGGKGRIACGVVPKG